MVDLVKHLKYQSPMVQEFPQNPWSDLYYFDKNIDNYKTGVGQGAKGVAQKGEHAAGGQTLYA
jgi:hypothetical protein